MKDTHLLPYILPNIFAISQILSATQFAALVLPSLKPLFVIKEPPQNMLTLLDNLQMLQDKTEKPVFRERRPRDHFCVFDADDHPQMSSPWCITLWTVNMQL